MVQFCAQYSRDVGEPLAGTGVHARSNLLLSWPIGQWTRTFHQAKDMTAEVARTVRELNETGRRINLIHQAGQPSELHRAYLMPERRAYDIPRDQLSDFLNALRQGESLQAWDLGEVTHRLVLCCTHGVKDKCCAKFGNASFKALQQAARRHPGQFEIWQSSHLGGCRLASAALVFPDMHKYGRVDREHAGALLQTQLSGQPYLPCYRGDGALSPAQQIADIEARRHLQFEGIEALEVTVLDDLPEAIEQYPLTVRWRSHNQQGELMIPLQSLTTQRYATCADIDQQLPPTPHSSWQLAKDAGPGTD